jgi:hypothetical protein
MTTSKKLPVTAAAAAIAVLAALLALRVLFPGPVAALKAPSAAAATVPAPAATDLASLDLPAWHHSKNKGWPLAYKTDLDLLAPLGSGRANAGEWLAQFANEVGPRAAEAQASIDRRVEHPVLAKVLPFDDPLLAEAEPWCDQAEMRFYPELFPLEGFATRLPNLLLPMALARTWVARGLDAASDEAALADFRRAIRLGRLLRQEDAILISDLVGLECIRVGAWGIFTRFKASDPALALVASVVVGEAAPQRLLTAERITALSLSPYLRDVGDGRFVLTAPDSVLASATAMATAGTDRRFVAEAALTAAVFALLGSPDQQARADELLATMAADPDPVIATLARWTLDHPPASDELREIVKQG